MVAVIEAPADQPMLMQQTFRAVLTALAEPLRAVAVPAAPTPDGCESALWSMILTLWDQDVSVWWPGADEDLWYNMLFHTRVQRAAGPDTADWLVLDAEDERTAEWLSSVRTGSDERPDQSASVIFRVGSSRSPVVGSGPGLPHPAEILLPLPAALVECLQHNQARYPLGFDSYLVQPTSVMGIPRSTQLQWGEH